MLSQFSVHPYISLLEQKIFNSLKILYIFFFSFVSDILDKVISLLRKTFISLPQTLYYQRTLRLKCNTARPLAERKFLFLPCFFFLVILLQREKNIIKIKKTHERKSW